MGLFGQKSALYAVTAVGRTYWHIVFQSQPEIPRWKIRASEFGLSVHWQPDQRMAF